MDTIALILSIIGSSGSGKTTLLRCLNFLETPDEGEIWVQGKQLLTGSKTDIRENRLHFGLVFQNFNLFPHLTIKENITLAPEDYLIILEIRGDNFKEVCDNGLMEEIQPGDIIEVMASNWIYMDGNFFYIIGLSKDNKEYLNKDEGLQNLIDYMNENKSLL